MYNKGRLLQPLKVGEYVLTNRLEEAAINFLEADFNQCFEQMRHYDTQILNAFKFQFTIYTGLIGGALGLMQYGDELDLQVPGVALLTLGAILGMLLFATTIRNRVYFVQVTRYINEQREFFFEIKPLGFSNKSKMYTSWSQPPYLDWKSSQIWFAYIMAFLNSILLGVLIYIVSGVIWQICSVIIVTMLFHILVSKLYLFSREGKTASEATFGKGKEKRC